MCEKNICYDDKNRDVFKQAKHNENLDNYFFYNTYAL